MLKTIEIDGYKSITKLKLRLARINVFIGENGAGKSNILEAIALAGAAEARKLDNEFLTARGIRVTSPNMMRPLFQDDNNENDIKIFAEDINGNNVKYVLSNDNMPYSSWNCSFHLSGLPFVEKDMPLIRDQIISKLGDEKALSAMKDFSKLLLRFLDDAEKNKSVGLDKSKISIKFEKDLATVGEAVFGQVLTHYASHKALRDFVVFSPENTALRILEREGQVEPLGINGEGLSKLLQVMSRDSNTRPLQLIKNGLRLFDWFEDFSFPGADDKIPERILIRDGFVSDRVRDFDQRSANEGFLFCAFYLALFASNLTPKIFAVDNIDASLNPKMCERMMKSLVEIAKETNKQIIMTTHNPSILDGIDLSDDDQKLFVISRASTGNTTARQINKKNAAGDRPVRLSSAFLNGALGGVPRNF